MPEEKNGRGERMRRYGVPVVRLGLSLFASDFASGRRSRCMYVPSEGLLPFRDRPWLPVRFGVFGSCRLWFVNSWIIDCGSVGCEDTLGDYCTASVLALLVQARGYV